MSKKEASDADGSSISPITPGTSLVAQVSTTGSAAASFANAYHGSMANTQQALPSLADANVMMMTNAAATIAAVAASAVQQMSQGQQGNSIPHSSAQSSAQSSLAAAWKARKPLISHSPHSSASANPATSHLAALLGAQPSSAFPTQGPPLNHLLGLGESLTSGSTSQTASVAISPTTVTNALLPSMQTWSLKQLEQHLTLLQQLNQPVPQYLGLLLSEARRKQEKKTAKRAANRKSAHTSRARKKAVLEEMTRTNARLKRQALILALLPDLVVAINASGEITFCSAQVERVLQHKIDDLIGAQLSSLLVPASRDALSSLVDELVNTDKRRVSGDAQPTQARHGAKRRMREQRNSSGDTAESKAAMGIGNGPGNAAGRGGSSQESGEDTSAAAIVSEQSFPLSVVEVDSKQSARPAAEINDNSDASMSNSKQQMSCLTNSTRSPNASSGDDARRGRSANGKRPPSSDDSSSLSSDAKNMSKANENLDRNVRQHNQRMMEDSLNNTDDGPKDDVTGASVTANNATARLSSLKHVADYSKRKEIKPSQYEITGDHSSSDDSLLAGVEEKKKAGENASDDSGYRESNDSREETSSSGSDTFNSNDRQKKPLAPAFRMCLIRQDLTTVWCEVTSSIRTRSTDEELADGVSVTNESSSDIAVNKEEEKELLLCLRPIRDGEKKVDESFRFISLNRIHSENFPTDEPNEGMVSSSSGDVIKQEKSSGKSSTGSGSNNSKDSAKRPPKKRVLPAAEEEVAQKRKKKNASGGSKNASDTEKSVVESLMLMNKSSQ